MRESGSVYRCALNPVQLTSLMAWRVGNGNTVFRPLSFCDIPSPSGICDLVPGPTRRLHNRIPPPARGMTYRESSVGTSVVFLLPPLDSGLSPGFLPCFPIVNCRLSYILYGRSEPFEAGRAGYLPMFARSGVVGGGVNSQEP